MKLKADIDYTAFLQRVKLCRKDVFFTTEEGDILNLKSLLSTYVFLSAAVDSEVIKHGRIQFREPTDKAVLAEYLEGA